MRRAISLCLLACVAGCNSGDQRNAQDRALNEMAVAMDAASSLVIVEPARSPAQRALFEKNLIKQSSTYLVLSASPDELNLLREIESLIPTASNHQSLGSVELRRIMTRTSELQSIGASVIGLLPDAGRRESVLFRLPTGRLGMLAVWDYKADQGKMYAMQEALTFNVAKKPASLSLSENPTDPRRLWTLGWNTDTEYYSLYLEDTKDTTGAHDWNPESIRAFAEKLTQ
ncbi:hypothetical protein [Trinickia diaoshuihuensis]|uniref:hypothetical protein n=1 Tax=Trinickia diaoshuihuensis TaxID=2292265 RepID=UPI0013C2B196|nr:hypothetical protein [Trinickia diaoshuihuensis]